MATKVNKTTVQQEVEDMEGKLSGEATAKQIEEWKRKYPDAWSYTADSRICYLKKADRTVVSAATTLSTSSDGKLDGYKFAEVIATNCWLGGDRSILEEDKYFMGLANKINGIVEVVTGELKKL